MSASRRFDPSRLCDALLATSVLAALAAWAFSLEVPFFPIDDAYISEHSAEVLFQGSDPRYPGSHALDGVTSPLHVLLIAALGFFLSFPIAHAVATALALSAYALGLRRLALQTGLDAPRALALTFLGLLSGQSIYQLLNGLETGLALAAVSWTLAAFSSKDGPPRSAALPILLGALPFVRPELLVLSGAGICFLVWRERAEPRRVLKLFGVAAGVALPGFLLLLGTTGALLPSTWSAKLYFFAEDCAPWSEKLRISGGAIAFFSGTLGLTSLGLLALPFARVRWLALAFLSVSLGAHVLLFPGSLWHNSSRYLYVLVPFAIAGWSAALARTSGRGRRVVDGALILAALQCVFLLPSRLDYYREKLAYVRREIVSVANWAAKHLPPEAPVLVHDAGYVSLVGENPLIDIVGLKTPSSVALNRRYQWPACPNRSPIPLVETAERYGARYLLVLDDWDRVFLLTSSLAASGWVTRRVDEERGDTLYSIYAIQKSERGPLPPTP